MKVMETVLSRSIRLIFTGGMAAGFGVLAQPAMAQEANQGDSQIQRVEITGSSIKRIAKEGSLPVQTLNRAEIESTGASSVTELLQKLPVMQGFTEAGTSVGGEGGGISTASIHGVGSNRTLVLLNGRRLATHGLQTLTGNNAAIDLNTIPLAAIERVEILTDGASALYGSDAIAGVVNFILRRNFQGVEVSGGGSFPKDGGREGKVSITGGFGDLIEDGHNIMIGYSHDKTTSLAATDRDFSKTGILHFGENGVPYEFFNGSSRSVPANINIGGTLRNPYLAANGRCPSAHQQVGQACYFDYASTIEISPEIERDTFLLSGQKKVGADTTLFADFLFGRSKVTSSIAPPPIDIPISTTSPFYSYAAALGATGDVTARWRGVDVGNRVTEDKNDAYQFAFGANGNAFNWDYTAAYTRSESKATEKHVKGWVKRNELASALDAGTINPFVEPGNQTAAGTEAINGMQHFGTYKEGKSTLDIVELKGSRPLMALPAGDLQLGAGIDWRRENVKYTPSAIAQGTTNGIAGDDAQEVGFDASRRAFGAFGELLVPVTKTLEVTGSLRGDHYSDFGSEATYKLGTRWTPTSAVMVRASYGTGFRAPSVPQVAAGRQLYGVTGGTYDCPFTGGDALAANCQPPGSQYNVYAQGNPNLEAEKSDQWSIGMRVEPTADVSVGFDLWNVKIENTIGQLAETTVFGNPDKYRSNFTTYTDPLSGETLLALYTPNQNLGNMHTQGIDFDTRFRFKTPVGRLNTVLQGTYMLKNEFQDEPGGEYFSNVGQYRTDPNKNAVTFRWLARLSNTLETGKFAHTLTANYKSGYTDQPQTVTNLNTGEDVENFTRHVSSYLTWDWQTAYTYNKGLKIFAGILNVFDRDPPFTIKTEGGHQLGYDSRYADARGRTFYISANAKF
jgi:iron complex outermembrane receptor protein